MDKQRAAYLMAPLTLAYIGDAVYDLHVRSQTIAAHANEQPHMLHVRSSAVVKAAAQARTVQAIMHELDDTELKIYKRGRNAQSGTVPKSASVSDYRMATGFEAVIGYLYMSGKTERLDELLALCDNAQQ